MKTLAAALLLTLAAAPSVRADPVILKMATLAPEGSSWMKLFHEWANAIEKRTEGRVKWKLYSGGVHGDERDMLRKIRLGQLHGAAITTIGLAAIDPDVRTLEASRNYQELDYGRSQLDGLLRKQFADKGYVLIGWGDVGTVHIFSNRPIRTLSDLQQTKMWRWTDDAISGKLLEALGVHGVPLGVPDVLPALSVGSVDAFFASPLSAMALQWSTKASHISSMIVAQATGATVLSNAAWEKVSPADREIILAESKSMETRLIAQVRADNDSALAKMKANGLVVDETPAELVKEMFKRSEPVLMATNATLSPEMQAKVRTMLEQYRARAPH